MLTNNQDSFSACTSILAGKAATIDGSTIIARNEDSKSAWPKHMKVHPHKEYAETPEFVSPDNGFKLSLPKVRGKYTATPEWTDKFGVFEEDGFNEYGVAMSATESAYANERVLGYDPLVKDGIGEEAMLTVVLPYIHSAREGVKRLGSLVERYGTCESNGILFSDQDEVWYLETGSGHHWVAQRIPDDSYAVVANQLAIQDISFDQPDNFMFSTNIQSFVEKHHLNPQKRGFNFRNIFGTHDLSDEIYSTPRVWYGQKYFNPEIEQDPMSQDLPFIRQADRLLGIDDFKYVLGSHFQDTPYDPLGFGNEEQKHKFRPISLAKTQESHILQIRPNLPKEIAGIHWLAMGVTAESVYIPTYAGTEDIHPAYKVGQGQYSSNSAYWTYKLVGVLVDGHYTELQDLLRNAQKDTSIALANLLASSDEQALQITDKQARTEFLTKRSIEMQQLGLDNMQKLISELVTRSTDLSVLNFTTDANL
ncbi:dipeptidase [Ligilactobacillus salitolerans]|uniref:Dipeptidase n=1 Tax=Ligilactobacillus salitolerans TaxID=1808352 RepID=A0A401IU91_9LACO|nr:C69 family dipeptidase [Ligilactobacillus salitolerans]GBG95086.1 dipeptidase [Ligilactobacillus salitolerans]